MSNPWLSYNPPEQAYHFDAWSVKLRGDELAEISFKGHVLIRSVRVLIRDQNWGTPEFTVEKISEGANQLEIQISSQRSGAHFFGSVRFGVKDLTVEIEMSLTSQKNFLANRIGLNVLLPPLLAGTDLLVGHSDGSKEKSKLPVSISPHQPVFDISALAWSRAGLEVSLEFSGDVFEMEDQRNWTDASYKIYSRPLSLPFPYAVAKGEQIIQKLVITVGPEVPIEFETDRGPENTIRLQPAGTFPSIQLGASSAPDLVGGNFWTARTGGGFPVLVEVDISTHNWRAALKRATNIAVGIDLRVICGADSTEPDFDELVVALVSLDVLRVAVFDSDRHVSIAKTTGLMKQALEARGLTPKVIVGARSHFTELNRNFSELPDSRDGLTFSITPMFHAVNNNQLVESIAMQRLATLQAVEMAGGQELHVGPITLRPRFNNVATEKPEIPDVSDLSVGYGAEWFGGNDARQQSQELATWLVASAAATSVPGVESLTYFEQWGPRGIESGDGTAYPVFETVNLLAEMTGRPFLSGGSRDGLIWALNFGSGEVQGASNLLLVANLRGQASEVQLEFGGNFTVVDVDAYSWKKILT